MGMTNQSASPTREPEKDQMSENITQSVPSPSEPNRTEKESAKNDSEGAANGEPDEANLENTTIADFRSGGCTFESPIQPVTRPEEDRDRRSSSPFARCGNSGFPAADSNSGEFCFGFSVRNTIPGEVYISISICDTNPRAVCRHTSIRINTADPVKDHSVHDARSPCTHCKSAGGFKMIARTFCVDTDHKML
jgi:hypothetical protein